MLRHTPPPPLSLPLPRTDYSDIPTAVFSTPPIGTVGLTEEAARARPGGGPVHVYRTAFRAMKHTLTGRQAILYTYIIIIYIYNNYILRVWCASTGLPSAP